MRRFTLFLFTILLILALFIPVSAANHASRVQMTANVAGDESCQVTIVATFHIEQNDGELYFPVPLDAKNIALNGSRVRTSRTSQARRIHLSKVFKNMTGDFTVTISYSLPDVIESSSAGTPQLQLPLLSGYESPITQLDFTVTMPGKVTTKPAFLSGYHHAGIEETISCTVSGSTVTGTSLASLKDHETLTMTLDADPEVFSVTPLDLNESNTGKIGMIVCGVLAALYWLIFLRALPRLWRRSAAAPEDVSAGELGVVMTLGMADLSLMAMSWAQMGYLQMRIEKNRIYLFKQMDMGNERSAFEQRCFRKLFDRRTSVDTSSLFYANLCRAVSKMSPDLQSLVKPRSGNILLFRALAALIGLFGGVGLGMVMTVDAAVPFVGIFSMAILGGVCGWLMQIPVSELFLRKTQKTLLGLISTVVWLIFSMVAGQFSLGLTLVLVQWIAGFMAFYGGRRTEQGKTKFSQIMGLRLYLLTVSRDEIYRICEADPEYFHKLAPYALALGVGKQFASKFGKALYPDCPYMQLRSEKIGSAAKWNELMEQALRDMNRRSRLLVLERGFGILASARSQPTKRSGKPRR